MVYILPPRRPKRSCGALSVLEVLTFTTAVVAVIVLERLSAELLLSAGVVVMLLALVRGVPLRHLRFPGGSVIA
ncbi:hypothetical protein [Amycolatopsis australiensis]|uniref:Uncharacterized protein n=1 Tax=Amycolatopsis australiensis TaxID=546364 RepID=A0A1K1LKI1_9PSEU|nr:hypothetical protein [Amycolatopsis australiensis]SFW11370.1 hypothetical protein SAMN04489730_0006 [Amycolatopsis australiensis]SFW12025.1 hypothetical protein SAMN04489730_0081 [Amycolatopsis australiensis]